MFRFEQSAVHEEGSTMIFMRSLQRTDGIACSMCRFHSRRMGDGLRNKIGANVVFGVFLTGEGVVPFFFVDCELG